MIAREFYKSEARLFKVLMHPVRLAILDILRDGEQCVCHMESVLGLRQAYISQHLSVLRDAGLVEDRRDGWNNFYRVTRPEIFMVLDAMTNLTDKPAQQASHVSPMQPCPCPKCQSKNASRSRKSLVNSE